MFYKKMGGTTSKSFSDEMMCNTGSWCYYGNWKNLSKEDRDKIMTKIIYYFATNSLEKGIDDFEELIAVRDKDVRTFVPHASSYSPVSNYITFLERFNKSKIIQDLETKNEIKININGNEIVLSEANKENLRKFRKFVEKKSEEQRDKAQKYMEDNLYDFKPIKF